MLKISAISGFTVGAASIYLMKKKYIDNSKKFLTLGGVGVSSGLIFGSMFYKKVGNYNYLLNLIKKADSKDFFIDYDEIKIKNNDQSEINKIKKKLEEKRNEIKSEEEIKRGEYKFYSSSKSEILEEKRNEIESQEEIELVEDKLYSSSKSERLEEKRNEIESQEEIKRGDEPYFTFKLEGLEEKEFFSLINDNYKNIEKRIGYLGTKILSDQLKANLKTFFKGFKYKYQSDNTLSFNAKKEIYISNMEIIRIAEFLEKNFGKNYKKNGNLQLEVDKLYIDEIDEMDVKYINTLREDFMSDIENFLKLHINYSDELFEKIQKYCYLSKDSLGNDAIGVKKSDEFNFLVDEFINDFFKNFKRKRMFGYNYLIIRYNDELAGYLIYNRDEPGFNDGPAYSSGSDSDSDPYYPDTKKLKITNLYIIKKYRGLGLSKKLLNRLQQDCFLDSRINKLSISLDSEFCNILIYRKLGFNPMLKVSKRLRDTFNLMSVFVPGDSKVVFDKKILYDRYIIYRLSKEVNREGIFNVY